MGLYFIGSVCADWYYQELIVKMNLLCSSSVSLLASSQMPTNSMTQHYCRTLRMIMWVCYFPSMLTGYCDITFKHTYIFLKGKERESWKVLGIKIVSKEFNISMSYALTLEKAMAPHSSTLAWKIPWTEEPVGYSPWVAQSRTGLSDFTFTFHLHALEKEMATHSSILAWRIPGMAELVGCRL